MNDQPDAIKPTRQRMRRAPGYDELTEAQSGGVARKSGAVRVWSQLENLYRNRRLTDEQYQAGQKYYADWWLGLEAGRSITMRWSEYISGLGGGDGNMDAAERRVFHSRRFAKANEVLEGLGTRKAVHWFVINDIKPEDIGRKFWGYSGRKTASAGAVTGIALSLQQLAKFYGLAK
jgi:hypothetical protein